MRFFSNLMSICLIRRVLVDEQPPFLWVEVEVEVRVFLSLATLAVIIFFEVFEIPAIE
jgi:hypothetical protein